MSNDWTHNLNTDANSVDSTRMLYRALLSKRSIQIGVDGTISVAAAAFRPRAIGEPISVDIALLTTVADSLKKFKPETGLAEFLCQVALDVGCRVIQELDPRQPDNSAHAHVYLPDDADRFDIATAMLADACTILVEYDRKRKTHLDHDS